MADMFDKEELSIVGGLFPNALATAEAEKLAQQELAYKRFSGAAGTQNPFAGLAGLSGMFATAGGQELRGLAGAQSPTMQLVSLRNQAAKQFDTNTPEGLVQMAQFLNQQGDAAGARQAIMVAQGQAQRMATLEKTGAETTRALREKIGTPENQAEQAYYNNLLSKYPDTVEGRALAADDFAKWKTEQKAKVSAAGAPVMPGTAKVTDLRTGRDIVKDFTDAPKARLDTVKRIGIYVNEVLAGNTTANPQVLRELVKLAGDNQIGQNEVRNILGSSGFAGNIIEGLNMFLEGKPTNVKLNDLLKGVKAIETYYAGQYNSGRNQAERVLLNSQFDPKIVGDLIPPAYQTSGQKAQGRVAPAVGTIVNGYSFSGGDPSKEANWKLVTPTAQ
jgi:hypothetical protein